MKLITKHLTRKGFKMFNSPLTKNGLLNIGRSQTAGRAKTVPTQMVEIVLTTTDKLTGNLDR